jgi:hypothetical protein
MVCDTTGVYTFNTTDANGCAKVDTLKLTVLPAVPVTNLYEFVCFGDVFTWNGKDYGDTEGNFTDSITLQDANGCDSVVTMHVTVYPAIAEIFDTATICEGDTFTWNAVQYTLAGDYNTALYDVNGCEYYAYLHLIVNNSVTADETITACDSYTWHGTVYTASGDYVDTL